MSDGIAESARGRLRSSPYSALQDVACFDRDGTLILEGSLPSHYLKQVAQTLVAEVDGVTVVINRIHVVVRRQYQARAGGRA